MARTLMWLVTGLFRGAAAAAAGVLAAFGTVMGLGTIWGRRGWWTGVRQLAASHPIAAMR